ncbi:hypothetical protein EV356DRAFT_573601 [Viridothelium virens]|uniref:NACHT domain-containing protein n=1 Tax=Viridothelium virens TaxID=1048519 RepID=A0A6A6HIN5_VIRVR|nr:hypothetical protein EV356DRAFT_573601 [Viridothelium virens]
MPKRRLNLGEYTVGWICALPIELAAATEMLDEEHKSPPPDQSDPNLYTLGRIGDHNVVLVCLSAGQIGGSSAAAVAARLKSKFKSFQFGLMVGVGGGVPSDKVDIRLGDVVISHPTGEFGGVVQYDLGKVEKTGQLIRTGSLNAPPQVLLQAVSKLRSNHDRRRSTVSHHLARFSHVETGKFDRDQAGLDRLFESSYDHNQGATCDDCSIKRLVKRKPRMANETVIHYGTIASGNRVMKDGTTRDKLSTDLKDVLCYEMEAAGLMNFFPCLVIRGICDYSDSHKNKGWQPFAAATAAACAREILSLIPGTGTLLEADREDGQILQNWSSKNPEVEKMRILEHKDPLIEGSCNWVFDDPSFISWWKNDGDEYRILWIHGDPGKGKTMMMMAIIDELSERIQQTSDRRTISYFFCQSTVPELSSTEGIIRGLTYSLAHSNRQLIKILQTKLKNGIDRENLLVELWDTLSAMIKDPSIDRVYLLVDALDECRHSPLEKNKGEEDLLEIFLNLLTRIDLSPWRKVKWILTSRNEPKISESLRNLCQDTSLEVNSTNVSKAVDRFIDIKCEQLACRKNYSSELLQFVKKYLTDNAGGTFLWVALICKELGRRHGLVTSDIKALLRTFPRDLVPLYDRMLELVRESQNAERVDISLRILRIIKIAYRPLHLDELAKFAELPVDAVNPTQGKQDTQTLVEQCGSFLTIRGETIHFLHQSTRDYFDKGPGSGIFSGRNRESKIHWWIATRALNYMGCSLKRNICNLKKQEIVQSQVNHANVTECIPRHVQYSVPFGFYHLSFHDTPSQVVVNFLQKHFLHWVEAVYVLGKPEIFYSFSFMLDFGFGFGYSREFMELLLSILPVSARLKRLRGLSKVTSARKLLHYRLAIDQFVSNRDLHKTPLQIYDLAFMHPAISGLLEGQVPLDEKPSWLKTTSFLEIPTSKCLRPLSTKPCGEYPISKFVISISSDSKQIALAMGHDIVLGCMERRSHHYFPRKPQDLKKLAQRRSMVSDVAFSPDNKKLAVASGQIELYEIARGQFVTISRHEEGADCHAVSFSLDSRFLASYSTRVQVNSSTGDDPPSKAPSVVRVWDLNVNAISKEFGSSLYSMADSVIAFSPDRTIMALSGKSTRQNVTINTVELCSIATGERIQQLNLSDHGGIERILSFRDRLFVFTGEGPIDITDPGSVIFAPRSTSLPGLYLERNRLICGSEPIFMLPTGIGLLGLRERKPACVQDNILVFGGAYENFNSSRTHRGFVFAEIDPLQDSNSGY